jgi:hypothetical protein
MKYTRANIRNNFESIQIDGIPEGFSFKEPDITISGIIHKGSYRVYVPLTDIILLAPNEEEILEIWTRTNKLLRVKKLEIE